ncbi:glycosyltransferase [Cellvibrio sp. KY-YJ-3]|nr:glycosyltransferase [Cellvibrio sp. KY-YJ-3]
MVALSDSTATEPASLSISCVTYNLHNSTFNATIESLACACAYARAQGRLAVSHLYLIDNGPDEKNYRALCAIQSAFYAHFEKITLLTGHGNLGYGSGNNLALLQTTSHYHLVLNPDVLLAENNISLALDYMNQHPQVGLLAPDAVDEFGERQYLAKRKPSLLVLLARAFSLEFMRKLMAQKLYRYEYRDIIPTQVPVEIELASGCYMFLRTSIAQQIGGFDPDFFMYFEDFNLSRRIATISRVVHHPELRIVHFGGGAFKKGIKHIKYFSGSFFKYKCKSHF